MCNAVDRVGQAYEIKCFFNSSFYCTIAGLQPFLPHSSVKRMPVLMSYNFRKFTYVLMGISTLSACAPANVTQSAVQETVTKDKAAIYQHGNVTESMKLEDVLARALRFNLDTKVAELDELIAADDVTLDQLSALPSVTAKVQRVGRNNQGGSSSFSLLTGTESLQPSISSEQYRKTQQLNFEWNLLDAGINLARARTSSDRALVAQERRRKIYHNVVQDAYSAFWRVAAAQSAMPAINTLLEQSKAQLTAMDEEMASSIVPIGQTQESKARLLDKRKQLLDLKERLFLAEVELKTLIDYPLDQPIKLDLEGKNWLSVDTVPKIKGDMAQLEETAFLNRPEVREEILNKRISTRDIKLSILETIPGINILFSGNRDSNKFLAEKSWVDGTLGLTQSITKIITLPARYTRAKHVDELSDKRRQALIAAIITQVHVSKARYDFLADSYHEVQLTDENSQAMYQRAENFGGVGMMSASDVLNAKIDASVSYINKAFAYANLQDSYGRFITTMGVDLWDADNAGLTVPDFAKQLKKNLSNEELFVASTMSEQVGG